MDEVYAPPAAARPLAGLRITEPTFAALLFLLLAAVALLAVYRQRPPRALPADAPATEFSSGRAMKHLRVIACSPHPVGTADHEAVRAYLVGELAALGMRPQVQETTAVNAWWSESVRAARLHNIVARLDGTGEGRAVMLAAHYDSSPNSPGASDDGAAVTALLETARALKAGPPLKNDVIFLFTDAEEIGLLGAKAFVDEHPAAKDVGLALNFEARGDGGPAIMFETSDDNGWLIREFGAAAPHPIANSLGYEIYKRLPNDTDLTIFKKAGMAGLNFAYIEDVTSYHTATDTLESLDERSLQHQGSYALALARHFGDRDLGQVRAENQVYFNPLGATFVRYPARLVTPLTVLALLALAGVAAYGLRRGRLTVRGILFGLLALPVGCIVAALLVTLVWKLVTVLHRGYEYVPYGVTYNSGLYVLGFVLLAVAVTAALYNLFGRRTSAYDLAAGAMLWWLLLLAAVSLLMPGVSYLLVWPLLFQVIGLALLFALRDERPLVRFVVLALAAAPALLLVSPAIQQFFDALTINSSGRVVVLVALAVGLLAPQLDALSRPRKWILPAGMTAAGLVLIGTGLLTAGFDRQRPKTHNLFYGLNADTGRAVWASDDAAPNEWTGQFIKPGAVPGELRDFFPVATWPFITGEAAPLPLAAPAVALVSDQTSGGVRHLRLRVASPRRAAVVSFSADVGGHLVGASVNGKPIRGGSDGEGAAPTNQGKLIVHFHGAGDGGVEIALDLNTTQPLGVRVNDLSYGLPPEALASSRPRPDYLMPVALPYSDVSFVTRSFTF